MTSLSLITVVLTTLAIMNEGSPICIDPPHIINKSYNTNLDDANNVVIPQQYNKTRRYWVAGSKSCEAGGDSNGNRVACPFYYVVNIDVNRIPQKQFERICSCSSAPTSGHGVSLVQCRAVYSYLPVQRRIGCINGIYNYTLTLEAFQTDCESVQPQIRYVPFDTPKSPQ